MRRGPGGRRKERPSRVCRCALRRGRSPDACLMERPKTAHIRLTGVTPRQGSAVRLLGVDRPLVWQSTEGELVIDLPPLSDAPVYVLKIEQ